MARPLVSCANGICHIAAASEDIWLASAAWAAQGESTVGEAVLSESASTRLLQLAAAWRSEETYGRDVLRKVHCCKQKPGPSFKSRALIVKAGRVEEVLCRAVARCLAHVVKKNFIAEVSIGSSLVATYLHICSTYPLIHAYHIQTYPDTSYDVSTYKSRVSHLLLGKIPRTATSCRWRCFA